MVDPAGTGGQLKQAAARLFFIVGAALAAALVSVSPAHGLGGQPVQKPEPAAPAADSLPEKVEPEAALIKTLIAIRDNRLDAALTEVEKVLRAYPNFRLAHLIKGDLLLARAQPLRAMGAGPGITAERVADLRAEARARLTRYQHERPLDRVPRYLLQLHSGQRYAFVVDTSRSTLYVFENHKGEARYVSDYYISTGRNGIDKLREGDKRTPLGVYHVTSSMPREKLADLYGSGAFPINYPNEWDRRQGRGGSGIWLHGTPSDTFSRPPQASDGCVVLTNKDLDAIGKHVQVGLTPVIISRRVDWVSREGVSSVRQELAGALEQWRVDWESRNTERYLAHYSRGFSAGKQDYRAFAQHKRAVNSSKQWIKLKLDNVSMLQYPGDERLVVVTFDQHYSSNNLNDRIRKRQYWIKEGSSWRIIYEGRA